MKELDPETYLATVAVQAGRSRHPEGVTFELTYGCNLRCVHCYNPTHRALPHELTTQEVCSIIDQMADLGVLTVSFSGGEPSVRHDIEVILRHTRRRGLLFNLLTNATRMTPAFADLLEHLGVAQLLVSIYGATAATYDCMTGVTGSFTNFLQGLSALSVRAYPVIVRMPVTTVNEHEVNACRDLVETHGFKFQYCLDIHPRIDGDTSPLRYRLDPRHKITIDQRMLGSRLPPTPADSCSPDQPFISCSCGHSRFAVTPYGEMNLCIAFPTPKYNLRTGTVREGWEVLKRVVDEARPNEHYDCPTCEVNRFCRQGPADAWLETGDMSSCLPHFKDWAVQENQIYALLDPRRPA